MPGLPAIPVSPEALKLGQPGLVDTRDDRGEADQVRIEYADLLVRLGLAERYGVNVKLLRLSHRRATYGIYVDAHDAPKGT